MALILSPLQCQMARAALRWRLDDLAECSGIHRQMIYRFEAGHRVPIEMKQTLRRVFEEAGLRFAEDSVYYRRQWNYEA